MTEAQILIRFAGPHVTLQDGGRPGWLRYGVPGSGAMDRLALKAANLALGNPPGQTVIEISRGGLQLECEAGALAFALAGGGFVTETPEGRGGSWQRGTLQAGQRLVIRPGRWGNWACLAFSAPIRQPLWLGSSATHGPSGLGGQVLRAGMRLNFAGAAPPRPGLHHPGLHHPDLPRRIPCPVFARPRRIFHLTPGPQERFFAPDALGQLAAGPWKISPAQDRMGIRLTGPELRPLRLDMPSEPLMKGALQISGDGRATVLMADHQTTGGYPKLATLAGCDLDSFSRCLPGEEIRFRLITPDEAIALARHHHAREAAWCAALHQAVNGGAGNP